MLTFEHNFQFSFKRKMIKSEWHNYKLSAMHRKADNDLILRNSQILLQGTSKIIRSCIVSMCIIAIICIASLFFQFIYVQMQMLIYNVYLLFLEHLGRKCSSLTSVHSLLKQPASCCQWCCQASCSPKPQILFTFLTVSDQSITKQ